MLGLDISVLEQIDCELTIGRIVNDLRSDFIFSPHYSDIYKYSYEELWDQIKTNLRSGTFEPELPITMEIPKPSGLSRPGSILKPADRFIYQALIDVIAVDLEKTINRDRVFSYVLLNPDHEFKMFEEHHKCWDKLHEKINNICNDDFFSHAIRADIANYFERLNQHILINLLRASDCPSGAINLLEELLLAWTERFSYGILQGMFPSDFLGNYYLVGIDSILEVANVQSARYVDDLYMFYTSESNARKSMMELCRSLRKDGLHLNERKSTILEAKDLLYEETQLDRMFESARAEVEKVEIFSYSYGFQSAWPAQEDFFSEELIELRAVEALYQKIQEPEAPTDSIERFCLPILSAAGSEIAIERALEGIIQRPHLAKLYCSYLWPFVGRNPELGTKIEKIIPKSDFVYGWQIMWPIATLLNVEKVETKTLIFLTRLLCDYSLHETLRAICAIVIGKHGSAEKKRFLASQYSNEPSDYVRSAILYASQFFPASQRGSCIKAWGGHSKINSLIANTIRNII